MGILKQIAEYLYIKKDKDKNKPKPSTYLRMMHGMNRISIVMFLLAMLLLLYRLIFK
ncbi:hypothetical protein SAMN05192529_110115 [Arachidicoccus rhizosphaerae]|uniref:Uncharacterized protein n=1 Tax=Arachidicoccus rhizosphaerae TaxID=551991 RepID=A0A1H3ZA54_9BACT|nr:DUF6728 family protein [Arachidicoccus rhizosphaerae]SEA20560.1 hypothetical protein SAMN05192529_110115 [Arachidicoccus rhizosphaerae]